MSVRKPHLPLLIDAFPVPPSHIPPTPSPGLTSTSFNPPPSRPPSAPLPPVPGPSRLTEADTLQLLLSTRGNRSRPSSKYSVASSHHNRDSVLSTSSAHSYYSSSYSSRPSPRIPSASDRSPTPSIPTSPSSFNRPSIAFSIDEESDNVLPPPALPRDVVSPMLPLSEDDDDAGVDHSPRRVRRRHQANESISSINMRDILGAVSAGEEDDVPASSKSNASPRPEASGLASSHSHKSSLAYLMFDEPLPLQLTPSRRSHSKSNSITLADLASSSTATLRSPSLPPTPVSPSRTNVAGRYPFSLSATMPPVRSPSPDIDTIIQSTPKPGRLSGARSFTMSHDQRKKLNSVRSVRSMRSIRTPADEFGLTPQPLRLSKTTVGRQESFDPDDSLDYIVEGVWKRSDQEDEKHVRELEKELENSGSDSDDSSIDLHTPLPHLMVRHGLLSPNSKLLPQSRSNTPYGTDGRPGSTMSTFSTVTKSGIIKDERDTPTRRVRHRDGKLLRGGVGLTTGLGWSDSEDEDAPSPLTKRLSTLQMKTRSSTLSSTSSNRPHPLSRSYSSGALNSNYLEEEDEPADEWGVRQTKISSVSNPPTAWSRKMSGTSASTRTSIASSGGRLSVASSNGRMSMASNGSYCVSDDYGTPLDRRRPGTRESASSVESSNNEIRTLSSGSTLSIPMPVTPQQDRNSPRIPSSLPGKKPLLGKNKALPPLPGCLSRVPSRANLSTSQGPPVKTPSKQSFPRARTFSSTSSSASTHSVVGVPSAVAHVRPLQLPRQIRTASAGDRPAVPVPSITSRAMRKASLPTNSVTPPTSTPSRSLSTNDKPRPRTGTGMVYKSSSNSSKLRPPMPLQSASLSTSSIGRPRPFAKPTAI